MPRNYERKTSRGLVPSDVMHTAAREVLTDRQSLRSVAEKHNIDKMTLFRFCRRVKDRYPNDSVRANAAMFSSISVGYSKPRQIFSDEEETLLVDYVLKAASMYFGLPPAEIRKLAYEYAIRLGKNVPEAWDDSKVAGREWFNKFMKRHPNIALRTPEATSLGRVSAFNKVTVGLFFDNLDTLYKRHEFTPENIWNVDETGVTTVQRPSRVVAAKGSKQVGLVTSAERGELVTLCCAVNAIGNSIPPMFVIPRVRHNERFVQHGPPGCIGVSHKSGWMTRENFLVFLQHFAKHTRCSPEHPVLLLLDNHESHVSIEAVDFAKNNGIHLLSFPPHCSHKLQPLDRTVYYPLKKYYNAECDSWMHQHPGMTMSIHDIPELVRNAYPRAAVPSNIQAGFKVSGIFPFDRHVFDDIDFMPSSVTDRPITDDVSRHTPGESLCTNSSIVTSLNSGLPVVDKCATASSGRDPPQSSSTLQPGWSLE